MVVVAFDTPTTRARFVQLWKVSSGMAATVAAKVTLTSPVQLAKAPIPKWVTVVGTATAPSVLQPANAKAPMLVTDDGIVTVVINVQSLNALAAIVFSPAGIDTTIPHTLRLFRMSGSFWDSSQRLTRAPPIATLPSPDIKSAPITASNPARVKRGRARGSADHRSKGIRAGPTVTLPLGGRTSSTTLLPTADFATHTTTPTKTTPRPIALSRCQQPLSY
mmetsp:Transcript_35289/g.106363  ORF Transcript_35289/g.106363 Transcript_35289/m.106363 type:complete len:220 (+) Transcript_35289:3373-4032(+)